MLDSHVKVAICKAFSEKEYKDLRAELDRRGVLPPGQYDIESLVRVSGVLRIGVPTNSENSNRLCPWQLLVLLLDKVNPATRAAFIEEAITRLENGEKPDAKEVKAAVSRAADRLLKKTSAPRVGAASFDGIIEEVPVTEEIEARA